MRVLGVAFVLLVTIAALLVPDTIAFKQPDLACYCPLPAHPICGTDHQTYGNRCALKCHADSPYVIGDFPSINNDIHLKAAAKHQDACTKRCSCAFGGVGSLTRAGYYRNKELQWNVCLSEDLPARLWNRFANIWKHVRVPVQSEQFLWQINATEGPAQWSLRIEFNQKNVN
uniref:Kazal-like domain-containing protein n=1 Tax=Anopheles minimus TaxID=112268 RepID=A0A182VV09_9DIPT